MTDKKHDDDDPKAPAKPASGPDPARRAGGPAHAPRGGRMDDPNQPAPGTEQQTNLPPGEAIRRATKEKQEAHPEPSMFKGEEPAEEPKHPKKK